MSDLEKLKQNLKILEDLSKRLEFLNSEIQSTIPKKKK